MSSIITRIDPNYCLEYEIGTNTKRTWGSVGIFCFEKFSHAKMFTKYGKRNEFKILKVRGVGKRFKPKQICAMNIVLEKYYKNREDFPTILPPPGTICFNEVEVLEEIK